MASANYAFQSYNAQTMARAIGRDVSVSPKQAIEICNRLRRRKVSYAKTYLQEVILEKRPVAFTRFTNGLGHKHGHIAAGRYPKKASQTILSLIENAEVNAQQKGLNTSSLFLVHLCVHRASEPFHMGRQRRRQMKRSHIEIVVQEFSAKDAKQSEKQSKSRASRVKTDEAQKK